MIVASPRRLDALRDLAAAEPVALIVRGDCMEPVLRDGQRIEVKRRRRYWPGDIVAFRSAEGRLLVHRVLGVLPTRRGWILSAQGDARSRPDNWVPIRHVLGRWERQAPVDGSIPWRSRRAAAHRFVRHVARMLLGRWPSAKTS